MGYIFFVNATFHFNMWLLVFYVYLSNIIKCIIGGTFKMCHICFIYDRWNY